MKRYALIFALTCLLALFLQNPASANDYIDNAAEALKTSSVYVYPGITGTDQDTEGRLASRLRADDNIVLVMLPEEALADTDLITLAEELSKKLGDSKIIGLAVGRNVIGYSPVLPTGVAADQMRLAKSVSNDSLTALSTYVKNMHMWLDKHPQPTVTPLPSATPQPTATPKPLTPEEKRTKQLTLGTLIALFFLVLLFAFRKGIIFSLSARGRKLNQTKRVIGRIQVSLKSVKHDRIREDLENACLVALGLIRILKKANTPVTYAEEKLPLLIANMEMQIQALIDHESRTNPLPRDTYQLLMEVLINYDELFARLQEGSADATNLLATIIESNDAIVESLGYLPDRNK